MPELRMYEYVCLGAMMKFIAWRQELEETFMNYDTPGKY